MQHTLVLIAVAVGVTGAFVLGSCMILNPDPFLEFQRRAGNWQNSIIDLRVGFSHDKRDGVFGIRTVGLGLLFFGIVYLYALIFHPDAIGTHR